MAVVDRVGVCPRCGRVLAATVDYTVDGVAGLLGPAAYAALVRGEIVPGPSGHERCLAARDADPAVRPAAAGARQATPRRAPSAVTRPMDLGLVVRQRRPDDAAALGSTYARTATDDVDWYVVSDLGAGLAGSRVTVRSRPRPRGRWSVDDAGPAHGAPAGRARARPRHRLRGPGPAPDDPRDHVVATDTNPRALRMAGLTAGLYRRTGSSCGVGNLFEPVAGERFDLIVSNPPFVVGPAGRFTYRDGGLAGDDVCRVIIRLGRMAPRGGRAGASCSPTGCT